MKIVTKKQMRLDELIKYVWEEGKYPSYWSADKVPTDARLIEFYEDGMFRSYHGFHPSDTFTVEVEEEVDEKTKLGEYGRLLIIHRDFNKKDLLYCDYTPTQDIGFTRKTHESNYKLEAICLLTRKAEMITVWKAEHGIPSDGTLEI